MGGVGGLVPDELLGVELVLFFLLLLFLPIMVILIINNPNYI